MFQNSQNLKCFEFSFPEHVLERNLIFNVDGITERKIWKALFVCYCGFHLRGKLSLLENQQMMGYLASYLQLNINMQNTKLNALNFPCVIIQANSSPQILVISVSAISWVYDIQSGLNISLLSICKGSPGKGISKLSSS